jgi:hypothetical protein
MSCAVKPFDLMALIEIPCFASFQIVVVQVAFGSFWLHPLKHFACGIISLPFGKITFFLVVCPLPSTLNPFMWLSVPSKYWVLLTSYYTDL